MIKINQLKFAYEKENVIDIDALVFPENGIISVIGPNGAGKSTLMKLISRIIPIKHDGKIEINGMDIKSYSSTALSSLRSYVPQNTIVQYRFTVRQFILFGMYREMSLFSGLSHRRMDECENIIKFLELRTVIDKYISGISGGELQKAHIARALFQNTPIMMLDEPISNIDIHYRFLVMRKLTELSKNKLIIYITHDVNNALNNSDKILALKAGKIVFFESPEFTAENLDLIYGKNFDIVKTKGKYIILDEESK
ncbi:ABC transporter ATP-binding protein [candidate division WOR-3 bacterium]|nr:ABC transporter ATP-binding protein [candidate division WOR-3 bacterium]